MLDRFVCDGFNVAILVCSNADDNTPAVVFVDDIMSSAPVLGDSWSPNRVLCHISCCGSIVWV